MLKYNNRHYFFPEPFLVQVHICCSGFMSHKVHTAYNHALYTSSVFGERRGLYWWSMFHRPRVKKLIQSHPTCQHLDPIVIKPGMKSWKACSLPTALLYSTGVTNLMCSTYTAKPVVIRNFF